MFVEDHADEVIFFNEEPFEAFIRRQVVEVHPFIKPFLNEKVWTEFFEKFLMMMKELLFVHLRNQTRQHRGAKRFFKDLAILMSEGNFTDEMILE
jgi:heme oxygenase